MSVHGPKVKCPDCYHCQVCSENRCRLCRCESPKEGVLELGTGFTYGQYLEWKTKAMRKIPVIDMYACSDCDACLGLCPAVFKRNEETGKIEVKELSVYPEEEVQEVINCCPKDCITWEDVA
ncbi:ferredoxin [Thermodesulfobacteriota bacterium]